MNDFDREKYLKNMTRNLQMLRAKLGLTQEEICKLVGVSRQTIVQAEKNSKLSWGNYLSLVFLFSKNKETQELMTFLNIYPREFDELFSEQDRILNDVVSKNEYQR